MIALCIDFELESLFPKGSRNFFYPKKIVWLVILGFITFIDEYNLKQSQPLISH